MKPFSETCPAVAFLVPAAFVTGWDRPARGEEQYRKGKELGERWGRITIGVTGVWGASSPDSELTSYERIGYHANTADLLRGFIDSGAELVVYRWCGVGMETTTIQRAGMVAGSVS